MEKKRICTGKDLCVFIRSYFLYMIIFLLSTFRKSCPHVNGERRKVMYHANEWDYEREET